MIKKYGLTNEEKLKIVKFKEKGLRILEIGNKTLFKRSTVLNVIKIDENRYCGK